MQFCDFFRRVLTPIGAIRNLTNVRHLVGESSAIPKEQAQVSEGKGGSLGSSSSVFFFHGFINQLGRRKKKEKEEEELLPPLLPPRGHNKLTTVRGERRRKASKKITPKWDWIFREKVISGFFF